MQGRLEIFLLPQSAPENFAKDYGSREQILNIRNLNVLQINIILKNVYTCGQS